MSEYRNWLIALVAVAVIAAGAGYFLGWGQGAAPASTQMASAPMARTPVYYQDPDGKPDYSPTPKKTADGRDYKPVYDESAPSSAPASQPASQGKVLYYRNPMGLPDTSPVPKKDSMGMDYIPVHENEAGADANVVQVSPQRVQMLGVRTAAVERRPAIARTIRATGAIQFDERRLAAVTTKVGGWVERLNVAATGETVRAGQPLLEIYSPDIVAAEQEYLVAAAMPSGAHAEMAHGDSALVVDAAIRRLRALDVPQGEIERLQRTGTAARRIAVLAPANGIVTEKEALLGMHVDPGMPLYKTAFKDEDGAVTGHGHDDSLTLRVFERLLKLKDADVGRIATFVMAETLASGSAVTDAFGAFAKVEARAHWSPDQTFFDLMRDRASVNGMLADLSGKKAADKLVSAKLKDQKAALATAAAASADWCPGWMAFPATGL